MRHPALRRSARHTSRREARADSLKASMSPDSPTPASFDPVVDPLADSTAPDSANQNRPAPGAPPDGDHNQGGARKEGIDYQRDLGSEQDA